MVSLDIYVNETARNADVILPAPSPLRRSHYDLALCICSRSGNVAKLLAPAAPAPSPSCPTNGSRCLRLTGIAAGLGPDADVAAIDEQVARAGDRARDEKRQARRSRAARSMRSSPSSSLGSDPSGCSTSSSKPAPTG